MPLNAGELTRWVTLQKPRLDTDERDEMAQPKDNWPAVDSFWAKIEEKSSGKFFQGMQSKPLATHKITIRWRDDIDSTMRFEFVDERAGKTRYFQIDGQPLDPEQRGEQLVCQCVEVER